MTGYVLTVVAMMGVLAPFALLALKRSFHLLGVHPAVGLVAFNATFFYWFFWFAHPPSVGPLTSLLAAVTIFASAMLLWTPLLRPWTEQPSPMTRLGYVVLATIPQTFAGITLALARHGNPTAGAILALASKTGLFVAFAIVFARIMHDESEVDDDDPRSHDHQPEPPPPDGIPVWVSDLLRRNEQLLAGADITTWGEVVDRDDLVDPAPDVVPGRIGRSDAPEGLP